ncbi:acylphosphatase [Sneathiella glossodoripedis]|uniref:acylphosphatase n=1 Tax=Sneathiella glossodoripedis TaxID=418853 RepID=UPI00046F8400|nr:acylphosphatase [Sneathiella glossodoripedis]
MPIVHARITGKVQGVGYRAWTIQTASKLGLTGWVRNRTDGSVEAIFEGDESDLLVMKEKCQDGPLFARVLNVSFKYIEATDSFTSFEGRPTV